MTAGAPLGKVSLWRKLPTEMMLSVEEAVFFAIFYGFTKSYDINTVMRDN